MTNQFEDASPQPAVAKLPQPAPAETPFNSATRMTGLRNLIFSLGMKSPDKYMEEPEYAAEVPTSVHGVQQRPVYERGYTEQTCSPGPQTTSRREAAAPSRLFTAQPEFLPPKPVVDITDKDREWNNPTKGHRDRRDAYDDVEILPSWRGQYRKKN